MADSSRMGQAWINQSSAREVDSQSDSNGVETVILETDFLDHWKTRWLVELLGDEMAHTYVMRLWFHCQTRKTIHFQGMTGQVLKVICKYPGDGESLKEAMSTAGFIVVSDDGISVPKFAELNSKMVSNWENGEKTKQMYTHQKAKGGSTESQPRANEGPTEGQPEAKGGAVGMVGMVGIEGKERVGRGGADRPTVSASPSLTDQQVSEVAEKAATAYQERRYKTPNTRAAYFPVLLQEATDVFEAATDKAAALQLFLNTCRDSPLPKEASFSDLAKSCGLKKQKAKTANPSVYAGYKDLTAERLAKQMAVS